VRPLGGLALVIWTALQRVPDPNPRDDQDLVDHLDVAFRLTDEVPLRSVDPARLQRAPQCAGQSTGR